jgi:hypothetical protein
MIGTDSLCFHCFDFIDDTNARVLLATINFAFLCLIRSILIHRNFHKGVRLLGVTSEHTLDLVHQTARVSLGSSMSSAGVGSVSMLIGNASLSVLSTSQASLGVGVVVSSTSGSGIVGEVTSGSVSRDTGVQAVNTSSRNTRGRSVNVESIGSCCARQVSTCDSLVSRSSLVSSEAGRSILTS